MSFKVSLLNHSAGELDSRIVATEEETCAAALEIISGIAQLYEGDVLKVTRLDD
jgi:hypothetical protein